MNRVGTAQAQANPVPLALSRPVPYSPGEPIRLALNSSQTPGWDPLPWNSKPRNNSAGTDFAAGRSTVPTPAIQQTGAAVPSSAGDPRYAATSAEYGWRVSRKKIGQPGGLQRV